ncbi:MAG: MerR family transcriptional regulator [Dinoroseobacter sp.]|nr:MerR family transcriptional regulator [Dinoroseobacter sp.]
MAKSADAFRTISEVADWLGVPTHVLRFWESKFPQVKPVKRAGGRRYYRPNDMLLLAGIRVLLHDDGMTIRGVQKILREKGVKHVVALADRKVADGAEPAATAPSRPAATEEDNIVDLPRKEAPAPAAEIPEAPSDTSPEAAERSAPDQEDAPEPAVAHDDEDQMTLFASGAEAAGISESPDQTEEPQSESAVALPDLPGPSPVGGPSLAPLLEQIRTASPGVANEIRQVLATQKDRLEALRDRLRGTSDRSGSDTDT